MFAAEPRRRPTLTPEEYRQLFHWLSIPRYAVVFGSTAVIAFFWLLGRISFDPRPILFGLVPVFALMSVCTEYWLRHTSKPQHTLLIQLALDLIGAAVGVFLTGGDRSPFAGLFILVVISASLVSRRTLLAFGLASVALYVAMAAGGADWLATVIFALIVGLVAFQSDYYFDRIRKKDEEILKLKDEFLFRTIHDLRSPSTVIRLVFDNQKSAADGNATEAQKKEFAAVDHALARMTGLIEDLLKTAQGESPGFSLKREPVDLTQVIRGAATELAPLMERRRIAFTYQPPENLPRVIGDEDKLKETFNNFLDNAIKYNRDGGTIAVTHAIADGTVETEVSDTGIGISEKSLSMLFSPYFRGDVGSEIVGTGLGLFMTRKLVQKMNGKVTVRSEKDKGTAFTVTLPRAK